MPTREELIDMLGVMEAALMQMETAGLDQTSTYINFWRQVRRLEEKLYRVGY